MPIVIRACTYVFGARVCVSCVYIFAWVTTTLQLNLISVRSCNSECVIKRNTQRRFKSYSNGFNPIKYYYVMMHPAK